MCIIQTSFLPGLSYRLNLWLSFFSVHVFAYHSFVLNNIIYDTKCNKQAGVCLFNDVKGQMTAAYIIFTIDYNTPIFIEYTFKNYESFVKMYDMITENSHYSLCCRRPISMPLLVFKFEYYRRCKLPNCLLSDIKIITIEISHTDHPESCLATDQCTSLIGYWLHH